MIQVTAWRRVFSACTRLLGATRDPRWKEGVSSMKRRGWLLLALDTAGRDGLDPVQVQKSLFLLSKKRGNEVGPEFYSFEPHNYGPFSRDIYDDLDRLDKRGYVVSVRAPSVAWPLYFVTPEGHQRARALRGKAAGTAVSYLERAVRWVKGLSFNELIRSIYEHYPEYRAKSIFRD
jgi:DNA-binding PadR family transcriptional regulator